MLTLTRLSGLTFQSPTKFFPGSWPNWGNVNTVSEVFIEGVVGIEFGPKLEALFL